MRAAGLAEKSTRIRKVRDRHQPARILIPLLFQQPHRRYNALSGDWVLVSPQRAQRPWQGRQEPVVPAASADYDPECYLCPGNRRANGGHNPAYSGVYVFDNDFPALLAAAGSAADTLPAGLLQAQPVRGECRVICYSAQHNQTLATMPLTAIGAIFGGCLNGSFCGGFLDAGVS